MKNSKVFILGSCVSRDAFNVAGKENFQIVNYFSRTSLASIFYSNAIPDEYSYQVKSAFQQRMMQFDFNKTFVDILTNTEFDILLVDFIDERFSIFEYPNGDKVTISATLNQETDFIEKNKGNGRILLQAEKWEHWKKGALLFIRLLKENNLLDKIVLNQAYWTDTLPNGKVFYETTEKLNNANRSLQQMYDFFEQNIPNIKKIVYSKDLLKAEPDHVWGLSPYHYIDDFYLECLAQLRKLF